MLAVIATWRRRGPAFRLVALAVAGVVLALLGDTLFSAYGGRRVGESGVLDPDVLSINFLLGLLVVAAYPAYLALSGDRSLVGTGRHAGARQDYLLLYVGIVFFLIASFFLFPIGNFRLPYIAWLGLIPLVANFDFAAGWKDAAAMKRMVIGFGLIFSFLLYQAVGAARDNRYACVLAPDCADLLDR
jgi:hypothetical protein